MITHRRFVGRSHVRKHPRGKESSSVDRRFSRSNSRVTPNGAILQGSRSETSVSPLSSTSKFRYPTFGQHLEDIKIRSSNRLSASNYPQV